MAAAKQPNQGESLDDILDPHRAEEIERVRIAGIDRLSALGVWLAGNETIEQIGDMLEAVEQFERAVRARGGDLMVDEPPAGHAVEPDNPAFALPSRPRGEEPQDYVDRVVRATERLKH